MELGAGPARPHKSDSKRALLRLDLKSDRIAADRIWARRTPAAILCMGMAPSDRLARFAFFEEVRISVEGRC